MPRLLVSTALLVCAFAFPAAASLPCTLTAVPLQVSAEGLAEPVGDILIRCAGGLPGQSIAGSMQVSVSQQIANAVTDTGALQGVTLSLETPAGFVALPVTVRPLNHNILFENILFQLNAQGLFHLKISGIRADAGKEVQAALQFSGNEQLLVQTPVVTVATSQPSLLITIAPTAAAGSGPAVPAVPDFNSMLTSRAPVATTRITEGFASAFATRRPDSTNGMRFLIRLSEIPAGAKIFAPDAIAGSNAAEATLSGGLGGTASAGLYDPRFGSSFLLSRVRGAAADGSGGSLVFSPRSGAQPLLGVSEADSSGDGPYLVYEVLDSKPSEVESAQIPFWLFLPTDRSSSFSVIRQIVTMAPLSEEAGSIPGAPVPRYRAAVPGGDCAVIGDCNTNYFPAMEVTPTATTSFTAAAGGVTQIGNILIRNNGGGLMEWQASVRYRSGAGWLTISAQNGTGNSTLRYDVNPASLTPGRYEADILIQLLGSPVGPAQDVKIPVTVQVSTALPPPTPAPAIVDVVSPGTRWGMPFAPGALAVLLGSNFNSQTTITVGGLPARVLSVEPTELTLELPPTAPAGTARVVATNGNRAGAGYGIDIVPVSPDTLFVLNSDGEVNSLDRPVQAGTILQIYFTGTRAAAQPLSIKVHERFIDAQSEILEQAGVELVKVIVPADFPTMPSEVRVCAKPAADTSGEPVCSYPRDIWIKAASK